VLTAGSRWHMFLSGDRDLESAHRDKLHFNLNYYYPMRLAIERKVRRLDYGLSTYAAKLWRGCRLEPLSFAVRTPEPATRIALSAWTRAVDRWYRHKHRALELGDASPPSEA